MNIHSKNKVPVNPVYRHRIFVYIAALGTNTTAYYAEPNRPENQKESFLLGHYVET